MSVSPKGWWPSMASGGSMWAWAIPGSASLPRLCRLDRDREAIPGRVGVAPSAVREVVHAAPRLARRQHPREVEDHLAVGDLPAPVAPFEPVEIAAADLGVAVTTGAVGLAVEGDEVALDLGGVAGEGDQAVGDVVLADQRGLVHRRHEIVAEFAPEAAPGAVFVDRVGVIDAGDQGGVAAVDSPAVAEDHLLDLDVGGGVLEG